MKIFQPLTKNIFSLFLKLYLQFISLPFLFPTPPIYLFQLFKIHGCFPSKILNETRD